MSKVKLSPKYQVVIPKEIREKLKLKPKQEMIIIEKDGIISLVPVIALENLRGFLKRIDTKNLRDEEDRI